MRKSIQTAVSITLFALATSTLGAEDLACSTKIVLRGGASKGADVKLKVEGGRITFLSANSFISTGKEGGGYSCSINTAARESKVKWSGSKDQTSVRLTDVSSGEESVLNIDRIARGYKITFDQVWSGYCGFGAEFPQSVILMKGRRACAITE